jgi:hypothetical protein
MVFKLLLLVSGAYSANLLRTQSQIFSTGNINKVAAMDTDGSFVYTATYGQVIKENKMDMHDFGVLNLADEGYADIGTLKVDDSYIYVTASKVSGGQVLIKVNKATMTFAHSHTFKEAQNTAYAMVLDDVHIYTGMLTRPGRVLMLKKDTLEEVTDYPLLDGEHDVKSLMWSAADPSHVYANCDTSPGRIVKILIKDTATCGTQCLLRKEKVTTDGVDGLAVGEDRILAGVATEDEFLYVGTFTSPAKVVKLKKTDMSVVGKLTLELGENKIVSMITDSDFVYVGTDTAPGKIVRIRRDGFVRVDALTLSIYEDNIDAMTHGNGRIFAGLDTSPARIVMVSGYLEPVDCILSDWGQWSTCSKTCQGGKQTRTRTVHTQMQNGGVACSDELSQEVACADDVVCPVECFGGQIWMAGDGTALADFKRRTCATRDAQLHPVVKTGLSHCQCPQHKPFWHGSADDSNSFCASQAICEKEVTTLCQASDLTCKIDAGRLILERRSNRAILDYHCRHHPGNRVEDSCVCLCKIGTDVA